MAANVAGSIEARWEAFSRVGNEAFRSEDEDEARRAYVFAIDEAERLFVSERSSPASTARVVSPILHTVACHNLAALERRAGNVPASQELLRRALAWLTDIAENDSLALGLRRRAADNIKYAVAELVQHTLSLDAVVPEIAHAVAAWTRARRWDDAAAPSTP